MFPTWKNQPHTFGSRLALVGLRLAGWTPLLAPQPGTQFVAPASPHTANSDFWVGLFWKWATRTPVHFVGKHTLFAFPLGVFMRAVGGIPIDRRRKGGNFVQAAASVVRETPEILLIVAPEGTRARADYWKTGFYYMAREAGVPLAVTVLDWKRKRVGVTGYVEPTGDLDADFARIRELIGDAQGKYPQNMTPVYPQPRVGEAEGPH